MYPRPLAKNKVNMSGHRNARTANADDSQMGAYLGVFFSVFLCIASVVLCGGRVVTLGQTDRELRHQSRQIDDNNRELEKLIGNRMADLERLKDGRSITPMARQMKLRPPKDSQNVLRFRLVRTEEGVKFEPVVVGYNR